MPTPDRAEEVRVEGYWSQRPDDQSGLPWPTSSPHPWTGKGRFLSALATVEGGTRRKHFKGFSVCRICGKANGASEFERGPWRWPDGFRHYVEDHNVIPSNAFRDFILSQEPSNV